MSCGAAVCYAFILLEACITDLAEHDRAVSVLFYKLSLKENLTLNFLEGNMKRFFDSWATFPLTIR